MATIADNLRSVDSFEILLGLCSGTVEGFQDSAGESVHLDDTPLDGFKGIEATLYPGDSMGTTVPLKLGGQASNNVVGVMLETGTAVTRRGTSVSPADIRFIEVRLLFSGLYKTENDGIQDAPCTIKIEYKRSDRSSWADILVYTITGKTTSAYVKEYRIAVASSTANYDIRVTKISPIENDPTITASVQWESFQEIIPEDPTYSDLAMLHVRGRGTNQLNSVPTIWSDMKLKRVKIPTGYDPDRKTYSPGIWNGTFQSQLAYTTNPIWILYDIATDAMNGVASYYSINLDKFSAYQVAKWCDEKVADGAGGTQPRFTLSTAISEPTGAKELLRYIAGLCATTYFDDGNGNAFLKADISTDPVALFTPENVIDGEFSYSYTDVTTRHNDITVEFTNPELGWQPDRRRVFDAASISELGRIPYDFTAIGCISEREAIRRARHHLLTSIREKQMVSFKTNRMGLTLSPYDVFLIGDVKTGYSVTGRVKEMSGVTLTLRDAVTLEAGYTYKAKFQVPNPDYPDTELNPYNIIERSVVSADPGKPVTQLTLNATLPSSIADNPVFSLESTNIFGFPKRFRLLGVKETEGTPDVVEVMGVEVHVNKWPEILGASYSDISYSVVDPFGVPLPPTGLDFSIEFQVQGALSKPSLIGNITGNLAPTNTYQVSYQRNGGPHTILLIDEPYFEIPDIPIGLYRFEVRAIGKTGKISAPFNKNFSVKENLRDPNAPLTVALANNAGDSTTFDLFPIIEWVQGDDDAFTEKFIIKIKSVSDVLINTYEVPGDTTSFTYDLEKIAADDPGRTFKMCVTASQTATNAITGVDFQQLSTESCITISNPKLTLTGVEVRPKLVGSEIFVTPVKDRDYLRTVIWADPSETFTPSGSNMVYSGADTVYHHVHYEDLWFRVAMLDSYDPTDYNISAAMLGDPKLIGDDSGQELAPFASGVAPVVLVATVAEMNKFLKYANVKDIPKFVYVTGTVPPVLYEYDPATNTYRNAIEVDLSTLDLTGLDFDVSQIPSNVMPNIAMDAWTYFGTASRIAITNGPAKYGCLVLQTPGTGETSGCKSPSIPITGGQTYNAGAWVRV